MFDSLIVLIVTLLILGKMIGVFWISVCFVVFAQVVAIPQETIGTLEESRLEERRGGTGIFFHFCTNVDIQYNIFCNLFDNLPKCTLTISMFSINVNRMYNNQRKGCWIRYGCFRKCRETLG